MGKPSSLVKEVKAEPGMEEVRQGEVERLTHEILLLKAALKSVLEYSRVRVIGGWAMDGRCCACNVKHVFWRQCPCPHHKAVELLKEYGVNLE